MNVFWNETAFPLCSATDSCWDRKLDSLTSPVMLAVHYYYYCCCCFYSFTTPKWQHGNTVCRPGLSFCRQSITNHRLHCFLPNHAEEEEEETKSLATTHCELRCREHVTSDDVERLPCFSIGSQVQDNRLLLVNESGNHVSAAAGLTDAAASRQVVLVGQWISVQLDIRASDMPRIRRPPPFAYRRRSILIRRLVLQARSGFRVQCIIA